MKNFYYFQSEILKICCIECGKILQFPTLSFINFHILNKGQQKTGEISKSHVFAPYSIN